MTSKTLSLFDDGHKTYRALRPFQWDGKLLQETPFGTAAYVGHESPKPPATGRTGHPWFGVANGRTWDQLTPIPCMASPEGFSNKFDINAEDIISVDAELGGGFVAWGRHDFKNVAKPCCPFGRVEIRRISNGEARESALAIVPASRRKVVVNHQIFSFDLIRTWYGEYTGNGDFTYSRKTVIGTRETLKMRGADLQSLGWTIGNDKTEYVVDRELLADNLGIFAVRNTPLRVHSEN